MIPRLPPSKENCRRQYARLFYLVFSQKKIVLTKEQRHKIWLSIGPIESDYLLNTVRNFEMLNHVVEMEKMRGRYQYACELAARIGLVDEALLLLTLHDTVLPDSELANVINYVHARELSTGLWMEMATSSKSAIEKTAVLESQWQSIAKAFVIFIQEGKLPNTDSVLNDFLILLVRIHLNKPHWACLCTCSI